MDLPSPDISPYPPPGPRPRSSRRSWYFAGAGIVLAALLAVVLFVGIGTGGNSSSAASGAATTSVGAQATAGDLQPGINAATGLLLSLTVFPKSSHKAAPAFTLTDQHGHRVSLAQFRGKVVIVSANDDKCTDLCTLLANDIVVANKDLGAAAKDVVWLSINANPFYPKVASVRQWTDEHGLSGQSNWYFGTGTPKVLGRIWRSYGMVVELDRKNRTVNHSTELFFVNPGGTERSVAQFGTASADTAQFSHGMAQMANDLLPSAERVRVAGPETPAPTATNATVGAASPVFSLPYLDRPGKTFNLAADRGHYVVLNFWASSCTVCRTELPGIEASSRFAGKHIDFVGIDESDEAGPARAMAKRAGLSYPLVSDLDGIAAGAERITGLPYTVILDPQGDVLIRHPGTFTAEQLNYVLANYDSSLAMS